MKRAALLGLMLSACAGVKPVPAVESAEAAPAEAPAPAPEVFPLTAGTQAPVDGLLVVPSRYIKLLEAEESCAVPRVPAGAGCSEPLVKPTTAFWAGMAVGSVVGVVATGLLVYGAVEVVKAAK